MGKTAKQIAKEMGIPETLYNRWYEVNNFLLNSIQDKLCIELQQKDNMLLFDRFSIFIEFINNTRLELCVNIDGDRQILRLLIHDELKPDRLIIYAVQVIFILEGYSKIK